MSEKEVAIRLNLAPDSLSTWLLIAATFFGALRLTIETHALASAVEQGEVW